MTNFSCVRGMRPRDSTGRARSSMYSDVRGSRAVLVNCCLMFGLCLACSSRSMSLSSLSAMTVLPCRGLFPHYTVKRKRVGVQAEARTPYSSRVVRHVPDELLDLVRRQTDFESSTPNLSLPVREVRGLHPGPDLVELVVPATRCELRVELRQQRVVEDRELFLVQCQCTVCGDPGLVTNLSRPADELTQRRRQWSHVEVVELLVGEVEHDAGALDVHAGNQADDVRELIVPVLHVPHRVWDAVEQVIPVPALRSLRQCLRLSVAVEQSQRPLHLEVTLSLVANELVSTPPLLSGAVGVDSDQASLGPV